MSVVKLASLHPLLYIYKNGTLALNSKIEPVFPPKASLLDRVSLYQGDITKIEVDAIVNAANTRLLGGGGVDGQIHRAAGRDLLKECKTLNGAETGESKITKGYNLPAKHVIHTVGPIYSASKADTNAEQLRSCYRTSLDLAVENKLTSIAFCSVSTGIYGYPIHDATHIALKTVREYLDSSEGDSLEKVVFVVWSDKDRDVYQELIPQYFPPEPALSESGLTSESITTEAEDKS
ncbi:hypothetical protein M422DRAFT_202415 [Sphaerobolus stellatus SS14]|nr:hypothetical protein M422DRAFT_202415 [Sphaerobolus stellatus SS14]